MKSPKRKYQTGNPAFDEMIHSLAERASGGRTENVDLVEELMVTALKIEGDEIDRGDVKMMNTALKELRYALKVFYPYRHIRKVAIFGSARTPKESADYKQALEFAKAIVESGWMVITGASSGIMSAGNEGAGRSNSFGVNIRLPFEQDANPTIKDDSKLINFKYFFTRKLIFIRESDATVLCPGGFGTHDEGFETLTLIQTGKTSPRPVICLDPARSTYWSEWKKFLKIQLGKRHMIDPDDVDLIHFTHDPHDAVRVINKFYRNYHSMRYIHDQLIFRIKKELSKKDLDFLNTKFAGILKKGKIEQFTKPFEEEDNEPHTFDLTRLAFHFNRRHFAGLKRLIDAVNDL